MKKKKKNRLTNLSRVVTYQRVTKTTYNSEAVVNTLTADVYCFHWCSYIILNIKSNHYYHYPVFLYTELLIVWCIVYHHIFCTDCGF